MGFMQTLFARAVFVVALGSFMGCAAFQPAAMTGPCRDSSGRFTSCASGGSGGDTVLVLGILGGLLAVAGVGYLIARAIAPTEQPAAPTPPPLPECILPVASVRVCLSSRGYRFALPSEEACATGARSVGVIPLTCEALSHPAFHACIDYAGGWATVHSWESCRARSMTDAPGDFVPPGRRPEEGVGPDSSRP